MAAVSFDILGTEKSSKLIDNGSIKEVGEFDLGLGLVTYYQETFRREFIHLQIYVFVEFFFDFLQKSHDCDYHLDVLCLFTGLILIAILVSVTISYMYGQRRNRQRRNQQVRRGCYRKV